MVPVAKSGPNLSSMNRRFRSVLGTLVALLAFAKQATGEVGNDNPTGPTGEYNGSIATAGSYDPYTGNAKRFVTDLTVTGSVGAYPLQWTRVVNSRNGQANAPLGQGGVWSHSYQWGAWVRPERVYHYYDNQYEGPGAEVTYPDGRKMTIDGWYSYPTGSGFGEPGDYLMAVGDGNYDLMMKDGGRVEFTHPSGIHLLATAVVDPYGQRTSLEYDSERRLWKITEPAGRYLQLNYTRYSYTIYFNTAPWSQVRNIDVISSVQAFDGRATSSKRSSIVTRWNKWARTNTTICNGWITLIRPTLITNTTRLNRTPTFRAESKVATMSASTAR